MSKITLSSSVTYDGTEKAPLPTVKNAQGQTLKKDVEYSVRYSSGRVNPGTYTLTIDAKGGYSGSVVKSFTIEKQPLDASRISLTSSYLYDGKQKTPSITVKNASGKVLVQNTDYSVSLASGRINAGSYTVSISGRDKYCGTISKSFTINKQSLSASNISFTATYTYDGKSKTPAVTVKNSAGTTLKSNTDYSVTYASGRVNAGTYAITVAGKGNYSGSIKKNFTIKAQALSSSKISLTSSYTYDGKVKSPEPTVKNSANTKLSKNTHYTVSYASGRKNAGSYKVTVTGKGNYSGSIVKSFTIKPQALTSSRISVAACTYNGKVQSPTVSVKNSSGTKLVKNTDFTLSYSGGRKSVGSYSVTVKGKGNYSGSIKKNFSISKQALSSSRITMTGSYTYDGKVKSPGVTVKNSAGSKLKKNTDYTVSYASGRKNVGSYTVTIKGKGSYTGTVKKTFTINPKGSSISSLTKASKAVTVKWSKQSNKMATTRITGYQIRYSKKSNMASAATKTYSGYNTVSKKITGLSAKTTYYFQVRTYKTVGKTKYYSGWSAKKSVKTK